MKSNPKDSTRLIVRNCGTIGYAECLDEQKQTWDAVHTHQQPNTVLIVEHPAVITLGARKTENKLITAEGTLKADGIDVVRVRRGGGSTAHNPGQVVIYPVLDLKAMKLGVTEYVRQLEGIGIELLKDFGLDCNRQKAYPGLWVNSRKIASIGVRVQRWVTYHGMAININNDLAIFQKIVPCGIDGVVMTSVKNETAAEADMEKVKQRLSQLCTELWG